MCETYQDIFMLHNCFDNLGLGEADVVLNADRCVAQRTGPYFLICAGVLSSPPKDKIILHFLAAGHTMCSSDFYGTFD